VITENDATLLKIVDSIRDRTGRNTDFSSHVFGRVTPGVLLEKIQYAFVHVVDFLGNHLHSLAATTEMAFRSSQHTPIVPVVAVYFKSVLTALSII
jgi:hypothetical protein